MPEICESFNVRIDTEFGGTETLRGTVAHTYVNITPNQIPYPIEPIRYVLGRVTPVFHIYTPWLCGPRRPNHAYVWRSPSHVCHTTLTKIPCVLAPN